MGPQRAGELRARGQFELHGRVITWLKEDVSLIASARESEQRAQQGFPADYICLLYTSDAADE